MRKILLATVAITALSMSAMAQQGSQPSRMQQPTGTDQSETAPQRSNQPTQNEQRQTQKDQQQKTQNEPVNPSDLSEDQVKQIQQALDDKGFNVKKVDGIWGPNTESALKKFQQEKNIDADGQLTQETLAELGMGQDQESGQSSTTGASSSSMNPRGQDSQKESPSQNSKSGPIPNDSGPLEPKGRSQQ